jgi:hypothetical protein
MLRMGFEPRAAGRSCAQRDTPQLLVLVLLVDMLVLETSELLTPVLNLP